jgi:TetR/AcrR family transcriptional repressor of nem operon
MEHPTKARIIEAAETLMLEKSFHSVGLAEILQTVNLPKGSFYHHFESKEQFGVEMLKHYVAGATAYKSKFLLSPVPEPNPFLRLMAFFDGMISKIIEHGGKCPCLIVKLSSEVADFSEPMRQVLEAGQRDWIRIYETLLKEARACRVIRPDADPVRMAPLLHDLWSGATQRAVISRSAAPLREALAFIRGLLQPSKPKR